MPRYTVNYEDPQRVEALPKGTSRKEGVTFVEAKKELVDWVRSNRDTWADAYRRAKKITRANLSLAPVEGGK